MKSFLFYICQNWGGGRLPPSPCFWRPWLLESHQSNQLCTLYRLLLSFITCMCRVYSLFWTNQSFHRYCACSFLLPFCLIFGSGMYEIEWPHLNSWAIFLCQKSAESLQFFFIKEYKNGGLTFIINIFW